MLVIAPWNEALKPRPKDCMIWHISFWYQHPRRFFSTSPLSDPRKWVSQALYYMSHWARIQCKGNKLLASNSTLANTINKGALRMHLGNLRELNRLDGNTIPPSSNFARSIEEWDSPTTPSFADEPKQARQSTIQKEARERRRFPHNKITKLAHTTLKSARTNCIQVPPMS